MKKRKAILAAVAATLTGVVALACAGCEWFSFSGRRNSQSVSGSLGYEGNTGTWLASNVEDPRSREWSMYQDYLESEGLSSDEFSFLDFLKEINDGSASLTTALRSSVAITSSAGAGSGVIYSLQREEEVMTAYVVTNYHVVYSNKIASNFYTYLYGDTYDAKNPFNSQMTATYVGGSMDEDIAVLKMEIPADRQEFVQSIDDDIQVRNSDKVNVGEKVYAIGNPLGEGLSVVSGVVGVEAEYVSMSRLDNENEAIDMLVMRVDAPVNHGNSGGGLFDAQGRLLGLLDAGKEKAVGNSSVIIGGFGYALPANRVMAVVQNIIDNLETNTTGAAFRGLLGDLEITSSKGEFDDKTQSIGIVETVKITSVDSRSPFGQDVVNKVIKQITIKDSNGEEVTTKEITRKNQIETLLYLVRKNFTVTLVFEGEGDEASVEYLEDSNFVQVK